MVKSKSVMRNYDRYHTARLAHQAFSIPKLYVAKEHHNPSFPVNNYYDIIKTIKIADGMQIRR